MAGAVPLPNKADIKRLWMNQFAMTFHERYDTEIEIDEYLDRIDGD